VLQLRRFGQRLLEKIEALCPEDAARLKPHFDRWIVKFEGSGDPTTNTVTGVTKFTSDYFQLGENYWNPFERDREDAFAVFLHEFRHLMKENAALYPGSSAYTAARLTRKAGGLDIEKDADRFALELFKGKCTFGSLK
jgi:hypothetical protein